MPTRLVSRVPPGWATLLGPSEPWRRHRRTLRRHRRAVSAGLCGVGLVAALHSVAPAAPASVAVLVAARDLTGGAPLISADLALARLPPSAVPAGALGRPAQAVGRLLAGPMRRGEPFTDVRLVGPRLVDALEPGLVATPVRVADAAVAALLRPGDRIDVLAAPADPASGAATTVQAADVQVLAVPSPGDAADDSATDGALVVLGTTARQATALAGAATADRLSVTLLGG